ncbi:hypothetical protein CVT91_00385 [Candidatus Atribacteria bacterium HGW-Atribacteria-1]|nr:MAG: hypothetical protein CVT91_00385 [Candidatus Atribacteria bacterium HGW-Atribacteria-1]
MPKNQSNVKEILKELFTQAQLKGGIHYIYTLLRVTGMTWELDPLLKIKAGQTMLGKGFGTPTHMAPEQFDNAAGCDERSDIYSFGIVLYQMVSGGQKPFLAPSPRDGLEQAMAEFWQEM